MKRSSNRMGQQAHPATSGGRGPAKVHAGDAAMRAEEAQAIGYRVSFRVGPAERYDLDAATLADAYAIARQMIAARGQNGRRPIIYAMLPKGRAVPIAQQEPPEGMS